MALNLAYYAPMQLIGWYLWRKNQGDTVDVPVKRLTGTQGKQGTLLMIVAIVGLAWYFAHKTDNPSPFADSFTTISSLLAMYLMVKRYSEQWVLWIACA
jgi:nicotinamide mononucleotide transporter